MTILGSLLILGAFARLFLSDGPQLFSFAGIIIAGACNTYLGIYSSPPSVRRRSRSLHASFAPRTSHPRAKRRSHGQNVGISGAKDSTVEHALTLLDYRRRVAELYGEIRAGHEPERAWHHWRKTRDELYTTHPQSPIPEVARHDFGEVSYYEYDPGCRVLAKCASSEPQSYDIPTSGEESMRFTRCGVATFELGGEALTLELYWLDAYGGGLFVPFRDATSGETTYGAGRYLLDTVKGADLGMDGDRLVLDFNFAYNPSCSYDPRWVCPLAPPANRLTVPVKAGERAWSWQASLKGR